jgi:hypothetical protein
MHHELVIDEKPPLHWLPRLGAVFGSAFVVVAKVLVLVQSWAVASRGRRPRGDCVMRPVLYQYCCGIIVCLWQ